MKRTRQRKCRNCGELYKPTRGGYRQYYCLTPACRAASKKASQKNWLHTPIGRHYHSGPEHIDRVQSWRKAHPGYWRRKKGALQDLIPPQPVAPHEVTTGLNASCPVNSGLNRPLQDLSPTQDPLVVGLIAHLTGALQDEIVIQMNRFQTLGQQILRKGPGIEPERSRSG
jgi:hypothetical protein